MHYFDDLSFAVRNEARSLHQDLTLAVVKYLYRKYIQARSVKNIGMTQLAREAALRRDKIASCLPCLFILSIMR